MDSDDLKSVFYLALAGAAAYAVWTLYNSVSKASSTAVAAVTGAQQAAASSVADAAQSIFGTGIAQPGGSYTVTMQDGSVQTVPYGQLPNYTAQNSPGALNGYRRRTIRRER